MQTLDLPWTEKYRPSTLNEVIGQKLIVERIKAFVKNGSFPNMIFAGSAGIGKTTCAIALAKDLYKGQLEGSFLELNASVTPDTPVLVRRAGNIERTTMGNLAELYFSGIQGKYAYPSDLEIASINKHTLKVGFSKVSNISRHRARRVRRIRFESGSVRTTPGHSVIIIDGQGMLVNKKAEELKRGDLLVTFKSVLNTNNRTSIDFSEFSPNEVTTLYSGGGIRRIRNPKIRNVLGHVDVDEDLAWFFGSYMAEGVTGFRGNTSGVTVLTYAYPKEHAFAERSADVAASLGFGSGMHTIVSGSSGRRSGMQVSVSSTQLARFMRANFYLKDAISKTARYKKMPGFVFGMPNTLRHEFLRGYAGDASGEWGDELRYTSTSKELLVDVCWLARISGLESSTFDRESRITWEKASSFYSYSELVPAEPFIKFMEGIEAGFNWRYELRHSLYYKRSKRIVKKQILKVLERIDTGLLDNKQTAQLDRLKVLASSDVSSLAIKDISDEEYDDYVYDVAVPGSEMFWGGTVPVLLHNSDARGIDVIRGAVKEFAKTLSISGAPIKIIFLDEADALTADAQHALRRTMEKFAAETRFILSANYASKIIEPIQSRCVVFRFKPLTEEDMREYIERVAKGEKLDIDDKVVEALIYVADGDMRKLTNVMQSAALQNKKITEAAIYEVAARARPKEIVSMLRYALEGQFTKARDELDVLMLKHGLSAEDILTQCYREVQGLNIEERAKLRVMVDIGECNFRIVEGANERIQLDAMLAHLALISKYEK